MTLPTTRAQHPILAALLILLATVFIAASMTVAKSLATSGLHPLQVSHARFCAALMLFAIGGLALRPRFQQVHWRWHLGRSGFGWLGVTLMFAAVGFIPMADAMAISFLNPVFAMILAIPLLGERIGPLRWRAAVLSLAGALILLRPTPASFDPAALLALAAAMVIGLEIIFIKRLADSEPPFQILLINNGIGALIATLAVIPVWQSPDTGLLLQLGLVGWFMALAQICFINGMARGDASFVAPISYATLIFATLYDFLFFDVLPGWTTWLGAAVILAGAALLTLSELRRREH
jgi:drug/metabolite transporter (DMT)-like permease